MTYLTTRDVADLVGVRYTSGVIRLIDQGKLPCERRRAIGGSRTLYYLTHEEVAAYLAVYDPALLPALDRVLENLQKDISRNSRKDEAA